MSFLRYERYRCLLSVRCCASVSVHCSSGRRFGLIYLIYDVFHCARVLECSWSHAFFHIHQPLTHTQSGLSAMHVAALNGKVTLVGVLVDAGAEVDPRLPVGCVARVFFFCTFIHNSGAAHRSRRHAHVIFATRKRAAQSCRTTITTARGHVAYHPTRSQLNAATHTHTLCS